MLLLHNAILLAGAVLVVVLVLALARDVRLRRALERLLNKLFTLWRNRHAEDSAGPTGDDAACIADPDDDRRLR